MYVRSYTYLYKIKIEKVANDFSIRVIKSIFDTRL